MRAITVAITFLLLAACSRDAGQTDVVYQRPINDKSLILLQEVNTGDLVCCSDTDTTTAEDCARALEATDCYVRVKDIPYRTAKYDFLTTGTFPTRRWRENETTARW